MKLLLLIPVAITISYVWLLVVRSARRHNVEDKAFATQFDGDERTYQQGEES